MRESRRRARWQDLTLRSFAVLRTAQDDMLFVVELRDFLTRYAGVDYTY